MKRKTIGAILGIGALAAVSSYGQGSVYFSNYNINGSGSIVPLAPITYNSNAALVPAGKAGLTIGGTFGVDLLWSVNNSTFTDLNLGLAVLGGNDGDPSATTGAGLFPNTQVTVTPYSSGDVWFIAEAYNGASYATSTVRGQSAEVELSGLATGTAVPGDMFSDNPAVITALSSFTVQSVPEPTTLALAGLGGLASLVAFRRKQA